MKCRNFYEITVLIYNSKHIYYYLNAEVNLEELVIVNQWLFDFTCLSGLLEVYSTIYRYIWFLYKTHIMLKFLRFSLFVFAKFQLRSSFC